VYSAKGVSLILKASLFATGCAGIVAEFVLSTLATYLIGNAIFQWAVVMSLMLFAMGLGSRLSRFFRENLLDTFILVEFQLSLLCALSAQLAYGLAPFTSYTGLIIYILAFMVGSLIGIEIPLVIRLNQSYEELRVNISGVLEKDYYGSLVGGLAFAFFALPRLGLTYTPIALGSINFLVAALLMWRFFHLIKRRMRVLCLFGAAFAGLLVLGLIAEPVIRYGEQARYRDKVIYAKQTLYQKIVITQWKDDYWLYINGQEQFSTYDEEKYHEPLVHPAMTMTTDKRKVLILGGGDGLALREVLRHPEVETVTLVDMDPVMTGLAREFPLLVSINEGSMNSPKVTVVNQDAAKYMHDDTHLYGAIIADLPDPDTVDLMHVYSASFYRLLRRHLVRGGVFVTQATSPYFSKKAFQCLIKTVGAAGFAVLPYHNHIPTMGERGWILAVGREEVVNGTLREQISARDFSRISGRFISNDAIQSMVHFGKGILEPGELAEIRINTELNPVLHRYYLAGSWGVY